MAVANIDVMVLRDVIKFIIQSVLFDGDVPYLLLSFLIQKAMELDFYCFLMYCFLLISLVVTVSC